MKRKLKIKKTNNKILFSKAIYDSEEENNILKEVNEEKTETIINYIEHRDVETIDSVSEIESEDTCIDSDNNSEVDNDESGNTLSKSEASNEKKNMQN